jgi:hypothetical protein
MISFGAIGTGIGAGLGRRLCIGYQCLSPVRTQRGA